MNKPRRATRHVMYTLPAQMKNRKQIYLWMTYIQLTVYTSITADIYITFKVYVFSEEEDYTLM